MTENLQLMRNARKSLEPYWLLAVLVTLVYLIISAIIGGIQNVSESSQLLELVGLVLNILITGPVALGFTIFALNVSRNNTPDFSDLFKGFNQYGRNVLAYLIMMLIIILGFVLLIVPGIIAALGLSMTLFIIADDPDISATDAIQKSWKMMMGYKWKYFRLSLRFIPWILLSIILLFVGFLFVAPWIQVTTAGFYEEIKENTPSLDS